LEEKKMTESGQPKIAEEMEKKAEPLSSTEKKLIGYSLLIGIVLLVLLVLVTGSYKF
jgi:hypothetical protein